jgi:hypothetical protein
MPSNTPSLNIKECIFNGTKHRKTSTHVTKEKKPRKNQGIYPKNKKRH